MPRVPVYERREEVAPVARPNVSATPNADALGAPVAQGVARLVQSTATVASELAVKEQDKIDKARTFDAYQKIGLWRQSRLYDTKTGYLNKRGQDALGDPSTGKPLASGLLEDYEKFSAELERSASNENQREAFRRLRAQERESIAKELLGHERRQSDAVAEEKYKAGQDTAVSNAANGYFDPVSGGLNKEALGNARTIGEAAVLIRAKEMGWPPEQTEAEVRQFRSRFHLAVLDRMTDNDHSGMAAEYLETNGHEIDGEIRAKSNIDKIVAAAGLKQRALAEADRIYALSPLDLDAMVKEANKIQDADLRDEVTQRVARQYSMDEKARDDVEKQSLGRVFQGIFNSGGYLDRTSKDFQSLRDDAKARAMDKADSLVRQSRANDAEARRIQQEYDRRALAYFETLDDKSKAASTFSENDHKVYDGISEVARYMLEARKNRAVKDIEHKQIANKADFDAMVTSAASGLSKLQKEKLRAYMTDWRIRWYDEHEQKPPTREEVKKGVAEAVQTMLIPGTLWDTEKKAFQLSEEERKTATPKAADAAPTPTQPTPSVPRVAPPKTLDEPSGEIRRYDPKTKRTIVYDAKTKKPLRAE